MVTIRAIGLMRYTQHFFHSVFFIIRIVGIIYFPIPPSPNVHSNGSCALCEVRNSLYRLQSRLSSVFTGLKCRVVVVTGLFDARSMFSER